MNRLIKVEIAVTVIILAFCICLAVFGGSYNAFADTATALPEVVDFDTTNVVDDLSSSSIDGEKFSLDNYGFDEDGDVTFFGFVEYCYSDYSYDNYGLYFYIYNPAEVDFDRYNSLNKIMLAIGNVDDLQCDSYHKYDISFVNSSSDEYGNLFLKFKVTNVIDIWNELANDNKSQRIYNLASFEMMTKGVGIVDYGIANTYTYTGFVKNHNGANSESSLTWSTETLNTLNLDVQSTWYRTGASSLGINHQNQINSVYFGVPNKYLESAGDLTKVYATWDEYKTDDIVCLNSNIYNDYASLVGKDATTYDPDVDTFGILKTYAEDYLWKAWSYEWVYNMPENTGTKTYSTEKESNMLTYLFNAGNNYMDYTISNDDLINYIYNYDHNMTEGNKINVGGFNVSKDLFLASVDEETLGEPIVDEGRTAGYNEFVVDINNKLTLKSYKDTHKKGETWLYSHMYKDCVLDESYGNLSPIVEYKEGMQDPIVNSEDLAEVTSYASEASSNNKTTYLVRYAVTDYYKQELSNSAGYIAQQTAFLNFDVITLNFNKNGIDTVIPVVSNPIAIQLGPGEPPEDKTPLFPGDKYDWEMILQIIMGIAILLIVGPWLSTLINVIFVVVKTVFSVIALPFKAISKVIRNRKNK